MIQIADMETYITGHVDHEEKNGWVRFSRFYPEQMETFRDNAMFLMCASMNAGMRLRMKTDAKRISFDVRSFMLPMPLKSISGFLKFYSGNDKLPKIKGPKREQFGVHFDCLIDGKRAASCVKKKGTVSFELPKAMGEQHEVEVVFPYILSIELKNLTLFEAASVEPIREKGYALYLGDSITQGADCVHPDNAWPLKLSRYWGLDCLNQGISGQVFCPDSLDALSQLPEKPAKIVCCFGTNDWGFASADKKSLREANMRRYFEKLHQLFPEVPIFVITPSRRLDEKTERTFYTMAEWRNLIAEEAARYPDMEVIHGEDLMPEDSAYYYDGFLHPTDEGAAYYYEKLLQAIREKAACANC